MSHNYIYEVPGCSVAICFDGGEDCVGIEVERDDVALGLESFFFELGLDSARELRASLSGWITSHENWAAECECPVCLRGAGMSEMEVTSDWLDLPWEQRRRLLSDVLPESIVHKGNELFLHNDDGLKVVLPGVSDGTFEVRYVGKPDPDDRWGHRVYYLISMLVDSTPAELAAELEKANDQA